MFRHLQDDKTDTLIKKYQAVFTKDGELTRFENWGIRPLAYHIDGFSRALYLLFNVYGPSTAIDELEKLIKFDDMLLRHIIIRGKESITEESPILKHNKAKSSREHGSDRDASQAAFKRGPATTDVATASPEPIKPEAPAAVVSDELKEEVVVNAAEEVIGDEPTAAIQESTATDVSDTVAEATNTEENTEEAK